jgi:hypothetical protein
MCLKAPTDFLAWRKLKVGEACPYCGYIEGKKPTKDDQRRKQ